MKGISYSLLQDSTSTNLTTDEYSIYDRVWDEADYVVPASETNAFFIMTNLVVTVNQSRGTCAEDHFELPEIICNSNEENKTKDSEIENETCQKGRILSYKSHGRESGNCIDSDRTAKEESMKVCEIKGWCPVELDALPVKEEPIIQGVENFTVLIKNTVSFPWFDREKFRRDNMPNGICIYKIHDESTWLCPIFRLGDIIELAGGNFTTLALKGGVISVDIKWDCDLDWNFNKYCMPKYNFVILDSSGWNFRHGMYHEENRRTLIKSYGLKFLLNVTGKAGKFDLTNTVIILVTGLGLMGFANILCDFFLLHSSSKIRKQVLEKKYEEIKLIFDENVLAESLKNLLDEGRNLEDILRIMVSVSTTTLMEDEIKSAPLAKEEDIEEFL